MIEHSEKICTGIQLLQSGSRWLRGLESVDWHIDHEQGWWEFLPSYQKHTRYKESAQRHMLQQYIEPSSKVQAKFFSAHFHNECDRE